METKSVTYEELKVIRRERFRAWVDEIGNKEMAVRLKCKASYVSQLCSGKRPITERTARAIEVACSRRPKSLDRAAGVQGVPA